jgi:hypothetical protein
MQTLLEFMLWIGKVLGICFLLLVLSYLVSYTIRRGWNDAEKEKDIENK